MTAYDRKAAWAAFDASYRLVLTPARCVYCGGRASGLDHVPPLRFVAMLGPERHLYRCCWRCNSALGPHPARCLMDRAAFLVEAYRVEWSGVAAGPVASGRWRRLRAIEGRGKRLKARLAAGDLARVCQCAACSADRIGRGLAMSPDLVEGLTTDTKS